MPRLSPAALACALALALAASSLPAATLAGVTMPERVEIGGQELMLNGMALRSKAIFKVYVAGLYLPRKESRAETILAADAPRHLVMEFVRSVGAESICDAWQEGLIANTPDPSAVLRQQFDTLCSWMEDVGAGESMAFTYLPGEGTRVTVKGRVEGTLPGKAFADALFRTWIGPRPGPGEGFKQALLGG